MATSAFFFHGDSSRIHEYDDVRVIPAPQTPDFLRFILHMVTEFAKPVRRDGGVSPRDNCRRARLAS